MKLKKDAVVAAMANMGLSKAALAEKIGSTAQFVSLVTRRGSCSIVTAGKIARALGVPVSEIVEV